MAVEETGTIQDIGFSYEKHRIGAGWRMLSGPAATLGSEIVDDDLLFTLAGATLPNPAVFDPLVIDFYDFKMGAYEWELAITNTHFTVIGISLLAFSAVA